jgi:hypothetical protein
MSGSLTVTSGCTPDLSKVPDRLDISARLHSVADENAKEDQPVTTKTVTVQLAPEQGTSVPTKRGTYLVTAQWPNNIAPPHHWDRPRVVRINGGPGNDNGLDVCHETGGCPASHECVDGNSGVNAFPVTDHKLRQDIQLACQCK